MITADSRNSLRELCLGLGLGFVLRLGKSVITSIEVYTVLGFGFGLRLELLE